MCRASLGGPCVVTMFGLGRQLMAGDQLKHDRLTPASLPPPLPTACCIPCKIMVNADVSRHLQLNAKCIVVLVNAFNMTRGSV